MFLKKSSDDMDDGNFIIPKEMLFDPIGLPILEEDTGYISTDKQKEIEFQSKELELNVSEPCNDTEILMDKDSIKLENSLDETLLDCQYKEDNGGENYA